MLMSERPSENDLDVYSLCGEYDAVNAPQFEADLLRFAEATSGTLTVDCTDLGFMDSTGIGALLRVEQALVAQGRDVRMVNVPQITRRVLEILDLTEVLGVADPD